MHKSSTPCSLSVLSWSSQWTRKQTKTVCKYVNTWIFHNTLCAEVYSHESKLWISIFTGLVLQSLGHLYSRDTSIQGTQNLVAEKCSDNLYWRDTFTQGKGTLCLSVWVPKPGFNLHSGDTSAIKKWLTTKIVNKFKCSLVTMATALKKMN